MSNTVRRMLGESAEPEKPFAKAPIKKVIEATRPATYQVCPHCNQEIFERHTYIDGNFMTGEYVERHSDCGGALEIPETDNELAPEWKFLDDATKESQVKHRAYLDKLYGPNR